jgi:hypothetical protein
LFISIQAIKNTSSNEVISKKVYQKIHKKANRWMHFRIYDEYQFINIEVLWALLDNFL